MDYHFFVMFVVPFINFFIFLFILIKFARNPLGGMASLKRESFLLDEKKAKDLYDEAQMKKKALSSRKENQKNELAQLKAEFAKSTEEEKARIHAQKIELEKHFQLEIQRIRNAEVAKLVQELKEKVLISARSQVEDSFKKKDQDKQEALVTGKLKVLQAL